MPKGPLGFPRLTTIGPFTRKRDWTQWNEVVDFESREWRNISPEEVGKKCKPYTFIDEPVEFIIPIEEAVPIGLMDYSEGFAYNDRKVFNKIREIDDGEVFLGIHETSTDKAESILDNGFSMDKLGNKSVNLFGPREDSVFTWHYIWDIGGPDSMSGVIVKAPREKVTVSDMTASVTVPRKEYVENYTMKYPDFIRCLKRFGPTSPLTHEDDIIQNITQYYP